MKQLLRLCQQEEKKLSQLGLQRNAAQSKIDTIEQQKHQLGQMVNDYTQINLTGASAMMLQNSAQMIQVIEPMIKQLTRKQLLLQQEQQRMSQLWHKQLGRQQGIKWLYQERLQQRHQIQQKQEQKQLDDLAARYATR
ncbi:flagellar FliJ family protein [uncultured Shewanella sp.]|uniref:flagellar FliJ family protein n=1 Tax=uncultured Shewanella sp. TaxID=173975 RepID=UPI00262491A5|nr:flagellar FliJ family protein [uncultured Shewanella sp.]